MDSGALSMRTARFVYAVLCASAVAMTLSSCGGPFFISEQDLAGVLGREYLYASVGAGVDAFEVDGATGRITKVAGSPFGGGCVGSLSVDPTGSYLYAAPYISSEVYGFRVRDGGTLAALPGFPFLPVQGGARAIAFAPDGRYTHIVHSSGESLTSYSFDAASGALTYAGTTLGVGCAPLTGIVDASSQFLYVSNLLPSRIRRYPVASGVPGTPVQVDAFAPFAFAVHPSRPYLYAVHSGSSDQNILAYAVDSATGALTPVAGSPYRLGFGPTNTSATSMVVDNPGAYLYATADDNMLYQYRIDAGTGTLALSRGLGSANAARLGASRSGRYVFAAGDDGVGNIGIRVYRVAEDGTLGEVAGSPFLQTDGPIRDLRTAGSFRLP
jgi:6-phosphogluconolactonase